MDELVDFHHFRAGEVPSGDRVARCEQLVVAMLLESELTESERDSSVTFELKHHHSVAQFARVLARKRGLPIDACAVGALLHDIFVIADGSYADHAHRGLPLAEAILDEVGGFSAEEKSIVGRIVFHHSDKHLWSDDPFIEFGKDVDVLDCFLYPGAFGYYLRHKRLAVFDHYLRRARLVWSEMGMPPDPRFEILRDYSPEWFEALPALAADEGTATVGSLLSGYGQGPAPPFLVSVANGRVEVALNRAGWDGRLDVAPAPAPDQRAQTAAAKLVAISSGEGAGVLVWPALESFEVVREGDPRRAELGL